MVVPHAVRLHAMELLGVSTQVYLGMRQRLQRVIERRQLRG